ncbi:hypothetical protein Ancab_025296, partial [Ancistrocladus abbreviatus]
TVNQDALGLMRDHSGQTLKEESSDSRASIRENKAQKYAGQQTLQRMGWQKPDSAIASFVDMKLRSKEQEQIKPPMIINRQFALALKQQVFAKTEILIISREENHSRQQEIYNVPHLRPGFRLRKEC